MVSTNRQKLKSLRGNRKKVVAKYDLQANFNCVDLCHDAAKHASMMALAAPSVVTTHQIKSDLFFEFVAPKFVGIENNSYFCTKKKK